MHLVELGANVHACDAAGRSLLHAMAVENYARAIRDLHALHRVDANVVDVLGNTPLHYAAAMGESAAGECRQPRRCV